MKFVILISMSAVPPEVSKKWHDEIVAETEAMFCTKDRLEKLCKELDLMAFSDLGEYEDVLDGASKLKDLPPEIRRAVKKIKKTKTFHSDKSGESYTEERIEFELHPKLDAIKEVISIMGIRAPERKELEINLDKPILIVNKPSNGKAEGDSGPKTGA